MFEATTGEGGGEEAAAASADTEWSQELSGTIFRASEGFKFLFILSFLDMLRRLESIADISIIMSTKKNG